MGTETAIPIKRNQKHSEGLRQKDTERGRDTEKEKHNDRNEVAEAEKE